MKVYSMCYSMRVKCSCERFSSLTHIASIPHKISGLYFLTFLKIQLSISVGINYTSSHLNMYIFYHKLIFVLFRGGEARGLDLIRKETLTALDSINMKSRVVRREMDLTRKETLVALSSNELTSRAARRMIVQRKLCSTPEMSILIPRITPSPWRNNGPLDKAILMKEYCGYKPVMGRGTDALCMNKFLEKVSDDGVQIPRNINLNDFFPAGAPLLDFLATTVEREESWKYPPKEEIKFYQKARSLSYNMLEDVVVKEIVVGVTTEAEIKAVASWMWDQWEKDQRMNPTQIMSLDNEEIQINLYDVYRLAGRIECKYPQVASKTEEKEQRPGLPEDRPCQLPTKIMFGNGMSYCVIISINLERNSRGEYMIQRIEVQDEIINLLESLPVCTGLGVRGDIQDIEFYYSIFAGRTVSLQGFIDLAALAVLAGYNLMSKSMTPMAMQVLGSTMNKCCSTGDGKWAYSWFDLPESLCVYGLADIMFGHVCYSVLSAILVRDIFPDPEITCKFFGVPDQWFALAWIQELISWSLDGIEIHNVDLERARSREEMILTLRYRYSSESPLMDSSPSKVKIWCRLLGGWPSITNGGCRYLIQAREKFIEQAQILKKSKFKWKLNVTMKDVSSVFKSYARFGMSPEVINNCKFTESVPFHYGLFRPISCSVPPLFLNPEKVKPGTIGKLVKKQPRMMKPVIFEWARMNPHKIQSMFNRLVKDEEFRKHFYGTYQGLRMIYRRIHNKEAMRIKELDETFVDNIAIQLVEEEERAKKSLELYKSREERCEHLRNVLRAKDDEDHTLCLEELPKLPEWKPRRRGRKRGRSKSAGRASKRRVLDHAKPGEKKDQDQGKESRILSPIPLDHRTEEIQVQDQSPDPESIEYEETRSIRVLDNQVMIVEDESEVELHLAGINDPKPPARKMISEKRKKKKGKKKGPQIIRSYDEIIEAKVYRDSEDDCDLEVYFSGELI